MSCSSSSSRKTQHGTNVGSRVYHLDAEGLKYKQFKLLNHEFTLDVDFSKLPCGFNGALDFVQMDADGEIGLFSANKEGANYDKGYCDAQCPHDIKFINGEADTLDWRVTSQNAGGGKYGACCAEVDIWEANGMSSAFTSHPCTSERQTRCSSPAECGSGDGSRYKGVCDKDGCDFNPFRMGNQTFYGAGSRYFIIHTTRKFTIVTQFVASDNTASGDLVEIRRLFKQNKRIVDTPHSMWPGLSDVNSIIDSMYNTSTKIFEAVLVADLVWPALIGILRNRRGLSYTASCLRALFRSERRVHFLSAGSCFCWTDYRNAHSAKASTTSARAGVEGVIEELGRTPNGEEVRAEAC